MNDSRENELLKNTVILSLGKFLPKLVSVVTLPIITASLTKAEYGTYDLIDTLIMLLIPIATLQIQSAAFRFLIEHRGDRQASSQIITNIFFVVLPISLLVSLGILLFMYGLSIRTRVSVAMLFFLDSIYNTSSQVTRGLGGNAEYAVSSIVLSIINGIGIVCALSILSTGLFGVVFSLSLANFVSIVFLWIRKKIYRYVDFTLFSFDKIKEMLAYSWPMVPNNLSSWVLRLSDRLVITGFLGVEANAVYAVANKIPNLLSLVQSVFVSAWQENASLAVHDPDADQYFTKMFDEIFSLMIGVTAILIAFTPIMFALLIRGDYAEAYDQIPILILGMFFYAMSAFQGGIYIAHKRTKSVGITTMVAAAVNLVVDFALVNFIGITAGSISTLIAYLVLYLYRMFDSLKFQPMDYGLKKQAVCFLLIVVMLVLCFLQLFAVNVINMILGFAAFFILNRALVRSAWKKMLEIVKARTRK